MLIRKIKRWSASRWLAAFVLEPRPRLYRFSVLRIALVTGRSPVAERLTLLANLDKFEIENDTSVVELPAPQYLIAEWDAIVR